MFAFAKGHADKSAFAAIVADLKKYLGYDLKV